MRVAGPGDEADDVARRGDGLFRVNHGATAGTARPTGVGFVLWVGSVEPTNAIDGDHWQNTA